MRIIKVRSKPYTVINGKDFAVYRWFEPQRHGPIFVQVAGRTNLTREDLPQDDWIVHHSRDRTTRIATAWRKPWFDYRLDATRKLAFLGASTDGSFYLALRYLARRFGIIADETELAGMASDFARGIVVPYPNVIERSHDAGLSSADLVTLDLPSHWERADAEGMLGKGV